MSKWRAPIDFAHGNRSLFVPDPDGNVVELADWNVDWAGEVVRTDILHSSGEALLDRASARSDTGDNARFSRPACRFRKARFQAATLRWLSPARYANRTRKDLGPTPSTPRVSS